VLLLVIFISSCQSDTKNSELIKNLATPVKLSMVNEWEIKSPEIIPNPGFFGALQDTTLILVDQSLNTINHFHKNGAFIRSFGGSGRGPGEFLNITHVAINTNGLVAVADINNARLSITDVYNETTSTHQIDSGWHTRLHWVSDKLVISNYPFKMGGTNPGDIFMRLFNPVTGEKNPFYHLDFEGEDDPFQGEISCTFCEHRFRNDQSFFTSPQDTSYRIYKVDPNTDETVLFTRSGVSAVKYSEQEREELQDQRQRAQQLTGLDSSGDDIPTHKRRFIDFFPDNEDRLWALVNPIDGEIPTFDLFSPDAEYIGSIKAPDRVQNVQFVSDNYILFSYESDDTDIWKGALYQILDK